MTIVTTTTAPYAELAAALRGDLIVPGDPGYDQARAVYNGMIDKHPAAIARCRDTADVITCVRFGREHGAEIAVRGGGHNVVGLGVGDGALVVDLSLLRSTTVSPRDHTVRVDAGCTWGDVDHATVAFGMATPSGFIASTGVAGLALGGGSVLGLAERLTSSIQTCWPFITAVALRRTRHPRPGRPSAGMAR
jgi:FAD/FMN-containing dehydrogenase